MSKPKIASLVIVVTISIFAIAQVALGQTGTPQPSGSRSPDTLARPAMRLKRQSGSDQSIPRGPGTAYSSPPQQKQIPQQAPPPQPQMQPQQQPASPPAQAKKQRQDRALPRSTPPPNVMSFETALQRYQRDPHPRVWWTQRYAVIVLVGGGYYYLDSGYWFPARGYDPNYEAYDYDGPIYTYGNLLPDQVILNVQRALTDLGYFAGALSGSLTPATRYAISAYQQDNGLVVNGVVDAPLVYSLGLQ
jgi:Putative peptidoglycan binding domain